MELRDVVSDVLVAGVTEKVQFGLVGPQNRPVRSNPMQAFSRMIEALFQLLIDALGDFLFKGAMAFVRLGILGALMGGVRFTWCRAGRAQRLISACRMRT